MNESTRQRLLDLNREFYATIAANFHQTRLGQTPGLLKARNYIPVGDRDKPVTVLDVGCGNGRFAHILEGRGSPARYTGVDADAQLLAFARTRSAQLAWTQTQFVQADLAQPDWITRLDRARPRFDVVLCTATMQHLPSYDLRLRVLTEMVSYAQKTLIVSAWQFLTSARFRAKLIDWATIGLAHDDVEVGDALLPWKQGQYAVRYVHQLDEAELCQLAADANLDIVDMYRADGKEGNLNLYTVLTVP